MIFPSITSFQTAKKCAIEFVCPRPQGHKRKASHSPQCFVEMFYKTMMVQQLLEFSESGIPEHIHSSPIAKSSKMWCFWTKHVMFLAKRSEFRTFHVSSGFLGGIPVFEPRVPGIPAAGTRSPESGLGFRNSGFFFRTQCISDHTNAHSTKNSLLLKEQFTHFASLAIWPLKFHLSTE